MRRLLRFHPTEIRHLVVAHGYFTQKTLYTDVFEEVGRSHLATVKKYPPKRIVSGALPPPE